MKSERQKLYEGLADIRSRADKFGEGCVIIRCVDYVKVMNTLSKAASVFERDRTPMTERDEIVAMLNEIRANIKPMSLCSPMETAIKNVYGDSLDFVLKKTINFLERMTDVE